MAAVVASPEVLAEYRAARAAYYAACKKADDSFARYFQKRQDGERTNGATTARLENEANYASTRLYRAQSALYALDLDPWDIDDQDGVERTPVGS
jgi:hypothetical protein